MGVLEPILLLVLIVLAAALLRLLF